MADNNTFVIGDEGDGTLWFSPRFKRHLNDMPGSQFNTSTHTVRIGWSPPKSYVHILDSPHRYMFNLGMYKKDDLDGRLLSHLEVYQDNGRFMPGGSAMEFHSGTAGGYDSYELHPNATPEEQEKHFRPDESGKGYSKILKGVLAHYANEYHPGIRHFATNTISDGALHINKKYLGMNEVFREGDDVNNAGLIATAATTFLNPIVGGA